MDHRSFRDLLLSSIGFAIGRNRDLLRRMLSEHVTDATREQLAKRVVEHLELSGFEIDEGRQPARPGVPSAGEGEARRVIGCGNLGARSTGILRARGVLPSPAWTAANV